MSTLSIRAQGLSKLYHIGERQARYKTLRESLTAKVSSVFRRRTDGDRASAHAETLLWALRDVSFDVARGEVVGVIGRNGAGKSTLLKLMSRITEPTEGHAEIHGRIGSLLEVGTGFHPELTGRENIYLNGAILGMRRNEIDRQLDQIVAFSEISRFLDTPVKHYSSGMYLRLAFAVAAHLETEVLVVDEILAVGDLAFQKKCLGKMEGVAADGRTVLFVSHNLGVLKTLCQSTIVLESGRVAFRGSVVEGLAFYSGRLGAADESPVRGTGFKAVSVNDESAGAGTSILSGDPFSVEIELDVVDDLEHMRLFCLIDDSSGNGVLHHAVDERALGQEGVAAGHYRVRVELPPLWLMPDLYTLHIKMIATRRDGDDVRRLSERVLLNVVDESGRSTGKVKALLIPPLAWRMSRTSGPRPAAEP